MENSLLKLLRQDATSFSVKGRKHEWKLENIQGIYADVAYI